MSQEIKIINERDKTKFEFEVSSLLNDGWKVSSTSSCDTEWYTKYACILIKDE